MAKECCSHEEDTNNDKGGVEIKSPRTAEHPGPKPEHAYVENEGKKAKSEDKGVPAYKQYFPTIFSLILLLSGIAFDYFNASFFQENIRFIWFAVAYFFVGGKVLKHAWLNIKRGEVFNEFFLMGLATLGAFYIGEYAEGVAVMLFYVVGEHFQENAVMRSRRSIKALIDNRPETATLIQGGMSKTVDPQKIKIGDIIQLYAGEKVALDGDLINRSASFNTAALTGESKPDNKSKGEKILAGMINLEKVVQIKVSAEYDNSALAKILKLIERATARKAKTQRFITRFAKIYTPIVVFLAVGITLVPLFFVEDYLFNDWLYRALIFLVVSCPCALVISIPLGYFGGVGAASRNGILFKGSNFMDLLTKIDTIVMDKTGTLTKGVFKVQKVETEDIDKEKLVNFTAALERYSTHPVARAVVNYAGEDYKNLKVENIEEFSGHGLKGLVEGKEVLAGNVKLLKKFSISFDKKLEALIESIVVVAIDGKYKGYIVIADELKDDAIDAVNALRELGVKNLMMLSGDKETVVESVAKKLNINQYFGGLLPQDKVDKVENLKMEGKKVAFVGDGINDAPVITLADVGIAMGGLGSDAAIETADVVIQNDQPSKIATSIKIGKATNRIVWQNIGMAFGVKAVVLLLGAGGMATLWEAVFADVGVAFLAILNAIRIQRMKF